MAGADKTGRRSPASTASTARSRSRASSQALATSVRGDVWRHRPGDGREARSRHRILVALGRLPRPFDQRADTTHVTGSALILGPRGVLLHRHKRLGIWLQPGGHLKAGESPWDGALREAEEETGLQLEWANPGPTGVPPLAHLDVHDGARGHTHLDLRYLLAVVGSDEPAPGPGESQDVRWFTWDEALAIADPGLIGFLRRQAGRSRSPGPHA
jgi:8-oxo-dGTP pyrophosphatase MutT (NUDIX family)